MWDLDVKPTPCRDLDIKRDYQLIQLNLGTLIKKGCVYGCTYPKTISSPNLQG